MISVGVSEQHESIVLGLLGMGLLGMGLFPGPKEMGLSGPERYVGETSVVGEETAAAKGLPVEPAEVGDFLHL